MVLVDTSVWIRALAGREPFRKKLDELLDGNDVAGHELIYGELLIGGQRGRNKLLEAYDLMHQCRTIPHGDVVEFIRSRSLHGRGVGWVDVHLLASAMVERISLWTADPRFANLADELGVMHET